MQNAGEMQTRCYHGTRNASTATKILKQGFKPDSWFALHLEDALAFGGSYIFDVEFDDSKIPYDEDGSRWQFHVLQAIPPDRILRYRKIKIRTFFDRKEP